VVRYRGECVKTAGNYTNSADRLNVIISEKMKKIVHFSPALLRGFPT
jgi:hypothetical protein